MPHSEDYDEAVLSQADATAIAASTMVKRHVRQGGEMRR